MTMANFNGGFKDGISIRGVPVSITHPGRVFWVYNGTALLPNQKAGSNTNDGSFNAPFSTVDYAIGRCTASRGDVIMVMPGHAENLTAAAAIVSDVAGVAIIGLGTGTLAPTFSWTTVAGATWSITAANCTFYNCRFIMNVADVTEAFVVAAGGDGLSFANCYFADTSTVLNSIDVIALATGVDNFSMENCKWVGKSASNDSFITTVATDGFYITDCQLQADVAQTAVVALIEGGGAITNMWIQNCAMRSNVDGAIFINSTSAANSGVVSNCYFSSLDVAGAITAAVDVTGAHLFECYTSGEADASGLLVHTVYNNA